MVKDAKQLPKTQLTTDPWDRRRGKRINTLEDELGSCEEISGTEENKSKTGNLHHSDKSEHLKIQWTRWQETIEKIATTAGETRYPKEGKILQDMLKTHKTVRQKAHKNKDGTGQSGSKENGKTDLEKSEIFERNDLQNTLNKNTEAGRAPPEASERRTWI